jgi:hypothetical protein
MFQKIYEVIGPVGIIAVALVVGVLIPFGINAINALLGVTPSANVKNHAYDNADDDTGIESLYPRVDAFVDVLQMCSTDEEYLLIHQKMLARFFTQDELVYLFTCMVHTSTLQPAHVAVLKGLNRFVFTDQQKKQIFSVYQPVLNAQDLVELVDFLTEQKLLTKKS